MLHENISEPPVWGRQKGVTPIGSDLFRFLCFLPICSDLRSLFLVNDQRLQNHYEIQQMAFSSGKIFGFSTLGVAENFRKPCDLRSKMPIPPSQEWRKFSQNPVAVFSCSG